MYNKALNILQLCVFKGLKTDFDLLNKLAETHTKVK